MGIKMLTQERSVHADRIRKELMDYQNKWKVPTTQLARYMKIHSNSMYGFINCRRNTYGRTLDIIEAFLKRERDKNEMD